VEGGSKESNGATRDLALLGGIVWSVAVNFVVAVAGLALVGFLLDRWLGTKPTFLLIGAGLGLVGGGGRFIRDALALNKRLSRDEERQRRQSD